MASDRSMEPWRAFLAQLDAISPPAIELHCIGGFALTMHDTLITATGNLDVCHVNPAGAAAWLAAVAGRGSELHAKHKIHLQVTTGATLPEHYSKRLIDVFPGVFDNLRILIVDPYDLALSMLGRNSDVDMDDAKRLARAAHFDLNLLLERYRDEVRPLLAVAQCGNDQTLALWLEAMAEEGL